MIADQMTCYAPRQLGMAYAAIRSVDETTKFNTRAHVLLVAQRAVYSAKHV
jgi:hypothetical protein